MKIQQQNDGLWHGMVFFNNRRMLVEAETYDDAFLGIMEMMWENFDGF